MSNLEFEFLGPYHVQKLIGRGGMGSVYQGIHSKSGQPVAIKIIAQGIANQPRFRRRFAAEIDALKRLKHPNIVSLVGYGEEKGILFYSMEFVEGQSLHEILRARKKLPWQDVVHVGIETTAALKHAHDIGIIHRDLKPANLMIDENGKIKLTDFGIAKLYGSADETMAGSVIGTADYMPPEQAEGRTVTVRSDLYSLGCVLYALLVGKPPFAGRSVPEVLYAVRYSSVPEIPGVGSDVPTELAELIYQLLDKESSKRPPTALVVGNRLKSVQQALGGKSTITGQTKQAQKPADRTPLTSTTNVGKKLTSLDMDEDVNLTKEDISDLVNDDSATKRSVDSREEPTLVASPSMLRRSALTGRENTLDSELSSEHLSPGVDTNRSQSGSTNASMMTSGGPSHYTPVTEADFKGYTTANRSNEQQERWDWTQIASIAGMIVALAGSVGLVWWKLQPQSADQLYDSILSSVESGDDSQLLASSDQLDEFLSRFPDDERASFVKSFKDEADLVRRVKILQRKAARSGGVNELSAAEQAFLDAVTTRNDDFQLGQEKLAAMISLFSIDSKGPTDHRLVELAKYAKDSGNAVNLTKDPVAKAQLEELIRTAESAMSADNLNRFYKNILLLYADKPWARDQVARIRKKLETER